jgi:pectin lyase
MLSRLTPAARSLLKVSRRPPLHIDTTTDIIFAGNVFQNVKAAYQTGLTGQIFTVSDAATANKCSSSLGHTCQTSAYGSSGALVGSDASILSLFSGKSVASATDANTAKNVVNTAGFGKI